jgi:hypothetical protein
MAQIGQLVGDILADRLTGQKDPPEREAILRAELVSALETIERYRGWLGGKIDELAAERAKRLAAESLLAELGARFADWHRQAEDRFGGGDFAMVYDETDIAPWLMRISMLLGADASPNSPELGGADSER